MRNSIALMVAGLVLLASVPAFAVPSANASERSFQVQSIKVCREMMKEAVNSGNMTNDQLKDCIKMMRTSTCTDML